MTDNRYTIKLYDCCNKCKEYRNQMTYYHLCSMWFFIANSYQKTFIAFFCNAHIGILLTIHALLGQHLFTLHLYTNPQTFDTPYQ